jgi:hypothetical protein
MLRFIFYLIIFILSTSTYALHLESKSKVPKFFYRTKDEAKYQGKEYLTVKSEDFNLLTKKHEVKDGKIFWKTIKIKIKNEQAVANWPYEIQDLIKKIKQKSNPRVPLFNLSLFANPISFTTVNQQRTINAGYRIGTTSAISEKHELGHDTAINHVEGRSDSDGSKQEMISYSSNLIYDFNRFYGNWTYFAITGYKRERFNGIYNIRDQVRLGLFGLKYAFIRNGEVIKKMDISYIPLYEWMGSDNDVQPPGEPPSKTVQTIRHSVRYRFALDHKGWGLNYSLNYQPAYYFRTETLDMQDIDLRSNLQIRRPLSEKLSLNYSNEYTYDIRRIRSGQQGARRDNAINTFSLEWSTEI